MQHHCCTKVFSSPSRTPVSSLSPLPHPALAIPHLLASLDCLSYTFPMNVHMLCGPCAWTVPQVFICVKHVLESLMFPGSLDMVPCTHSCPSFPHVTHLPLCLPTYRVILSSSPECIRWCDLCTLFLNEAHLGCFHIVCTRGCCSKTFLHVCL
jgi:hypothetical protein